VRFSSAVSNSPSFLSSGPVRAALVALACLVAWDAGGADLAMARWFGSPVGFPLRDNWFLVHVVHEGARVASWVLLGLLLLGIRWPAGLLRRLGTAQRAQLTLTILASVAVVSLLKQGSRTSCPGDLQVFGGVAKYVSHWAWGAADGGPGGCFPAGHASAAFACLGGYFVFRRTSPAVARAWLAAVLALGLVLGIGQQMRGAHFMSHTLWTAWLCWAVALIIDRVAAGRGRSCEALTSPFSP
jgi:membrane-associated PAP2 superfamily phosphatase